MGTRHVIAVYVDGEYKIAQYGQWDGYPSGQGLECLHFLRDEMNDGFVGKVRKCEFISRAELNKLMKDYGMRDDGSITLDDYDRFSKDYPEFLRDTGSKILSIVQNGEDGMKLLSDLDFVGDSWCEWAYVIDFDKRRFEVYVGSGALLYEDDRFYHLQGNGNHPVVLEADWSLDELPTDEEFVRVLE